MANKPFLFVIGRPKLGKTTQVLKTFKDALLIESNSNNHHHYDKLLNSTLKDKGYRPPKRTKLIDTLTSGVSSEYAFITPEEAKSTLGWYEQTQDGVMKFIPDPTNKDPKAEMDPRSNILLPVNQIQQLELTANSVLLQCEKARITGKEMPYRHLIFDEFGEFMDRVHDEILPTCRTKSGEIDTRGAFAETGKWLAKYLTILRQITNKGVGVVLTTHDREPAEDDKNEKKHVGGLKAPSANLSGKLLGLTDGAVRLYLEKDEDGKYRTAWEASKTSEWDIGLRGIMPEEAEALKYSELDEILQVAGYDV